MKRLNLLIFILCLFAASVSAQKTVSGTITDVNGIPLIGANVLIKGTTTGTIADIDGKFELQVPNDDDVLVISYTGYTTLERSCEGVTTLDIVMNLDAIGLEDIVIVGYAPQKRKDITGSISSIKESEIADVQLPSIETALQGRAAGVNVVKNSGKPGGGIDVNIRGRTSITASNQPLYVVDGIPVISGDNLDFSQVGIGGSNISVLADLNPNEIESIEVLKDASTAAAYGSRAANGVVLITTKKGSKTGDTKISVNASRGGQVIPEKFEGISGEEYKEYSVELWGPLLDLFGLERTFENVENALLGPLGNANTDWQDEIFRTGDMTDLDVNVSGGDAKTQYFASLGYSDENGILKNTGFQRYSGRLNLNHIASDKFSFGMRMSYVNSETQQVQNDNNIYGAMGASLLIPPVVPIFNEDGSWGSAFGIENAVAAVTDYSNFITRGRLQGNVNATYNIIDELSFTARLGTDIIESKESVYEPRTLQSSATGIAQIGYISDRLLLHEYLLNFNKSMGSSTLSAVFGTSFQEEQIDISLSESIDFPTDDFTGLTSGASPNVTNSSFAGNNLKSYFFNAHFGFDEKYFITTTFRADGSSRFINNQWGYFPGVSAGLNLTEILIPNSSIDLIKLRLSWGQTGNNVISDFAAKQLYGGGANYENIAGTVPTTLGNPDLKWETTTQTNIGIDFGFADNRISGSIDFYVKDTEDLLLNRPIPTTSGFLSVLQNVGEVQNRGIDFTLNTVNFDRGDFTWSTTFTLGYLQNEVKKLVDGIPIDAGFATRIAEGQSLGAFFGAQTDGLFQNQAEIDAHASQPNAAPGDIRFKDISGGPGEDGILGTADDLAPDGVINDNDRTYLGKALADYTGGISNSISFKGIELNAFFQFAAGYQIYNNNKAFTEGMNSVFSPSRNAWENRWKQEGDQTDIPRLVRNDPNGNRRDSDRFVEDGDYIRLKTVTIAYNLPKSLLSGIGIEKLRLYASGYNLWTATKYSGFDSEVNMFDGSNTALGTDFLTYPQSRSIIFGINVSF